MSQASYSTRLRRATWLAFGAAPVVGLAAAWLLRWVRPGEHFWLVFAGLLLMCAFAMWACVPWWNRLDDMQKQYHTVSWYWGGVAGGSAALMLAKCSACPASWSSVCQSVAPPCGRMTR